MKLYGDGKHGAVLSGLGSSAGGMAMVVLGQLTYYLTTQTGLSGTLVGTILLCSRVFDGISDLIAGFLIDRCHFKLGKARPFDLFAIPMWITLVLCFAVPDFHQAWKVVYVFIMYNLCQTVFGTLHSVAGTIRLKRTFVEEKRPNVVAIAGVLTAIFATAVSVLLPILIANLENEPNGWIIIACVFAIPGILLNLCVFLFLPEMKPDEDEVAAEKVSFKEFSTTIFQNKYLIMIIITVMAGILVSAINGNVGTFFFKYVYGDLAASSLLGVVSIVGYFFLAFVPVLAKKLGNRKAMLVSFALVTLGSIGKLFNYTSLAWLAICSIFTMTGVAFCGCLGSLVLIDTMRYGKLKTGKENDGVYSAISGFANKVANGIAPFIVGATLDLGGFDAAQAVQSAGAQTTIILVNSAVPAIIGLIGFLTMLFCKMEKEIKQMEDLKKQA